MTIEPATAAEGKRPSSRVLHYAFWIVLTALALAGMSNLLLVFGFMMLLLPGVVLYLAPTVLLYAVLAALAHRAWRGGSRKRFAAALALAALVAFGPGLIVNTALKLEASQMGADARGEFAPVAGARTISLTPGRGLDCEMICATLLAERRFDAVIIPTLQANLGAGVPNPTSGSASIYRLGDAEACARADGSPVTATNRRPCIIKSAATGVRADLVLRMRETRFLPSARKNETAWRLNPLALGRRQYASLDAWNCLDTRRPCRLIARRASFYQEAMAPILWMDHDLSDHGLYINRAWARLRRGDNRHGDRKAPSPLDAAAARLSPRAPDRVAAPSELRTVVDLSSMPTSSASAPARARRDSIREVIRTLNAQTEPLSDVQVAFLRQLLAEEDQNFHIDLDWSLHPEAARALVPVLGGALNEADRNHAWTESAIQSAIAVLPDADYAKLRGALTLWMRSDRPLAGENDAGFLLRLSDLGQVAASPLADMAIAKPGVLDPEANPRERVAAATALCVLGASARSELPRLVAAQEALAHKRWTTDASTALERAVTRIRDGGPGSACFGDTNRTPYFGKSWLEAFRKERNLL